MRQLHSIAMSASLLLLGCSGAGAAGGAPAQPASGTPAAAVPAQTATPAEGSSAPGPAVTEAALPAAIAPATPTLPASIAPTIPATSIPSTSTSTATSIPSTSTSTSIPSTSTSTATSIPSTSTSTSTSTSIPSTSISSTSTATSTTPSTSTATSTTPSTSTSSIPSTSPTPSAPTATLTAAPTLVSTFPAASLVANTDYIKAPKLVSTGMTGITAFVPVQAGASYLWAITGGTLSGVIKNAAVQFAAGAVGTATLTCTVTLNGAATTYVQEVPVQEKLPATPFYYGSGFSADALANTQVGGTALNAVSYRFQAKHASALDAIRVFFIWSMVKTGYHAGLGGTVQVDLLADDGTGAHLPTGPSLSSVSYSNILSQKNYYPRLVFPYPAILKGGAFYHLVFTNTDPSPTTNFVSLDSLYTNAQTAPMQGCVSDAAWAVLVKAGAGPWKPRPGFTPTLELEYRDGGRQGNGYMEVWSTNPKTISGLAAVRETFKVSGPSRTFSRIALRLRRLAGSSPLTVRVEQADGTLIQEGTLPAAAFLQTTPNWATITFPLTQALASGASYHLVLSSPADTQYQAFPIRKGGDKGFSNSTFFPDGYAQFTTTGSTGWTGWDMWGTPNLTFSDLQFMFVP